MCEQQVRERTSTDSHDKVRQALEALLRQVKAGRFTGERTLRILCNDGGVNKVMIGEWVETRTNG